MNFCRVTVLAACLFFGQNAAAMDPIPRRWTTIGMDDVDPTPYRWEADRRCGIIEESYGYAMCHTGLDISPPSGSLRPPVYILVRWAEAPTTGSMACGDERLIFYTSNTETAWGGEPSEAADIASRRSAVLVKFDRIAGVDRNVLGRIGADILRKFELYAVPCTRGEVTPPTQVAGSGSHAPLTPEEERNIWGDRDTAMPTDENLGVLGTSDPCRDTHAGNTNPCPAGPAHALLQQLPAVFPPGTRLQSIRFFPGPGTGVPMNQRAYDALIARQLEYLYWEIELSYPDTAQGKQFRVDTVVLQNGRELFRYQSGQQRIVPDSTQFHHLGHGRDGGGFWQPGDYEFKFYVGGDFLASRPVKIE